jgi:DNA-3-methyladenine glycosylase
MGLGLSAAVTPQPAAGPLLARDFFARPSTEAAPALLGCVLACDSPDGLVAAVIVETEAYAGASDPASHAYRGQTARNAVMFGPPGHAYVYFSYGMHFCVNLVCAPDPNASAVLLRAGRVIAGLDAAMARRSAGGLRSVREVDLARGPGRLGQALAIDRALNGADVCEPASPLRVLAPGPAAAVPVISRGPRVGISRAVELPWRFWITGERAVSAYRGSPPGRAPARPAHRASPPPGPATAPASPPAPAPPAPAKLVTARAADDETMPR